MNSLNFFIQLFKLPESDTENVIKVERISKELINLINTTQMLFMVLVSVRAVSFIH